MRVVLSRTELGCIACCQNPEADMYNRACQGGKCQVEEGEKQRTQTWLERQSLQLPSARSVPYMASHRRRHPQ